MAKLTSIEKSVFKLNREQMQEKNIKWAFCRETGITVIYQVMPKGNFIKLSVAYCNKNDIFKKKVGLNTAMSRWENDMAIQIPIVGLDAEHTIILFAKLITWAKASIEWVD